MTTAAQRLAAWTRLEVDEFGIVYTTVRPDDRAEAWAVVQTEPAGVGASSPARAMILRACRQAETFGFLHKLCEGVTRSEAAHGRSPADIGDILSRLAPPGVMQGMTDRAKSMMNPRVMFPALSAALEATAIVRDSNGGALGTCFLVTPDMVLTSAHVVLAQDLATNTFGELKPGIVIEFPASTGEPAASIHLALSPSNPLAASSPPLGQPPDALTRELDGDAELKLDFALLRLSRRMPGVEPININPPGEAEHPRVCFIIGYPGGNASAFDADQVLEVPKLGARIYHAMNTIKGMSGSCCIGHEGKPVALHEGGLSVLDVNNKPVTNGAGHVQLKNRAVSLLSIRRHLARLNPDPLTAPSATPGVWMSHAPLVGALRRKGERLAGPALEADWRVVAGQILGQQAVGGPERVTTHPWFERQALNRWIRPADRQSFERVAFVTGDRGVGKSFAIEILAEKLDRDPRRLFRLTPTEATRWSWTEALAQVGEVSSPADPRRPQAATAKYETIDDVMNLLGKRRGALATASDLLFVAIDCDIADDFGLDDATWRDFVLRLSQTPWIRLLVAGLSEDFVVDLEDRLTLDDDDLIVETIRLSHVGEDELARFYRSLYAADGTELRLAAATEFIKPFWAERTLRMTQPDLASAEAALTAIHLARAVLP